MDKFKKINSPSLTVAFFNANGLRSKRDELEVFVKEHSIDVMMVNETRLKNGDWDPKLLGYVCHRSDRPQGNGGGVAIYVRSTISHSPYPLPIFQTLEAIGVTIGTANLISVYCPPSSLQLGDLIALHNSCVSFIAAGDLNAKHASWFSRMTNAPGRLLSNFASLHDIDITAPIEPTYHNSTTGLPDTLDIALVRNSNLSITLETIDDLSSDHSPVLMQLGRGQFVRKEFQSRKTDWQLFSKTLTDNYGDVPTITSARQIEEEVGKLERKIKDALTSSTQVRATKRQTEPLPGHILTLIRQKKRARRRAHRTNDPNDKREANRLTTEVRYALLNFRNDKWNQKIQSLDTDDSLNSLWKMARSVRKTSRSVRFIHGTQGLVYSDSDKAEAFADHLESSCRPDLGDVDIDHVEEVERLAGGLRVDPDDPFIPPTSPAEVKEILKNLNPRKAPGPDSIPNKALKNLPLKLIVVLVTICNAIFRFQHFPSCWKSANVIFIPKPGKDSKFPQNYRPISLLNSVSKVVERLILTRLLREVETLGLLPDEQFGFRPKHSTVHQLSRVIEYVHQGFYHKNFVGAVFLDVTKAFDKVWHDGLIFKLHKLGISRPVVKLIKSFLTRRSFRAQLRDSLSSSRPLEAGVPQGAVISPQLFSLFISDMPKPPGTSLAVYADDTAILARSLSINLMTAHLQRAADILEAWFKSWGIGVNPEKSAAVLFTRRLKEPETNIQMFGRDIPWQRVTKYLGVQLDRKLTFLKQFEYALNKGKTALNVLYPLVGRRSMLSLRNKVLLFKAIIRPVMLYASPVWGHLSKTNIKKLQVVQNKFLRSAFNAPWFVTNAQLHEEGNLPWVRDFMKDCAVKFYGKAETHPNPLVRAAVDYDEEMVTKARRPKTSIL